MTIILSLGYMTSETNARGKVKKASETTDRYVHMKHSILLQMKLKSQNEVEV
jgi:hypothetical protein